MKGTGRAPRASKNPYICEFCGRVYVVRSLAIDCEDRHIEED